MAPVLALGPRRWAGAGLVVLFPAAAAVVFVVGSAGLSVLHGSRLACAVRLDV